MTGRIINNLIEVRQGDSYPINVCVKQGCKPVDLTGATMTMQVRDSNNSVIFTLNGTAVDVLNGKMALLLSPTETSIPVGDYVTDIQITGADGSVNTIFPANVNQIATFRITEQVTQGV
ncbi:MAG: hypothetical protein IJ545_02075 [Alphaproteobacteria bacterium]|nr:hypothetical protein [Alphaproteobacteria bacterium]